MQRRTFRFVVVERDDEHLVALSRTRVADDTMVTGAEVEVELKIDSMYRVMVNCALLHI